MSDRAAVPFLRRRGEEASLLTSRNERRCEGGQRGRSVMNGAMLRGRRAAATRVGAKAFDCYDDVLLSAAFPNNQECRPRPALVRFG